MKILIVDDKMENRYLLESMLKGNGYQVDSASNGKEALDLLKSDNYKLIVSDILMPEMDGYQLCLECKKDRKFKNIPFVFYTATYTSSKDEELALQLGAAKFIRKPAEPDKFIQLIREVLDKAGDRKWGHKKVNLNPETEVLKSYSQRLVEKLEHKMLELEASERKYHNLCENVNDLIFSLDSQGRFDIFNNQISVWGYSAGEIKGKLLVDILAPESQPEILEFLDEARRSKLLKHEMFNVKVLNLDGSVSIGVLNISSNLDENNYMGIYGVIRDINKLVQREREYKQLIDGMNDSVFVINFEGRFIEINNSASKNLGYTRDEFLQLGPAEIDSYLSPEKIKQLIHKIPSDQVQTFETRHKTKEGEIIPVEISSSLITYHGETVILSVARDITRRFKAEEELMKYQENLEELVKERTAELENVNIDLAEKNTDLLRMHQLFIGREFRIKELRDKVKDLEVRLEDK
jgi:PAS domain S-box-containing protein